VIARFMRLSGVIRYRRTRTKGMAAARRRPPVVTSRKLSGSADVAYFQRHSHNARTSASKVVNVSHDNTKDKSRVICIGCEAETRSLHDRTRS
jgi:hypothetical protein